MTDDFHQAIDHFQQLAKEYACPRCGPPKWQGNHVASIHHERIEEQTSPGKTRHVNTFSAIIRCTQGHEFGAKVIIDVSRELFDVH